MNLKLNHILQDYISICLYCLHRIFQNNLNSKGYRSHLNVAHVKDHRNDKYWDYFYRILCIHRDRITRIHHHLLIGSPKGIFCILCFHIFSNLLCNMSKTHHSCFLHTYNTYHRFYRSDRLSNIIRTENRHFRWASAQDYILSRFLDYSYHKFCSLGDMEPFFLYIRSYQIHGQSKPLQYSIDNFIIHIRCIENDYLTWNRISKHSTGFCHVQCSFSSLYCICFLQYTFLSYWDQNQIQISIKHNNFPNIYSILLGIPCKFLFQDIKNPYIISRYLGQFQGKLNMRFGCTWNIILSN